MFKLILVITLCIFLAFFVTLNILTEQSEISIEENVKNATDFSLKIKSWLGVETPEIDGRLQVRIDLPQNMEKTFVVKNFKIIIREFPINNSVNSGYNMVPSVPFILGHTLFSEARVKKGFLYEVIVNHPVKMAEDKIKTYIIREVSSEPFSFSLDKNISSLSFSLPDGIRLKKISDNMLLIENASCVLLKNPINLSPLSEQVIIQYDPFLHHVYLRFSEGLASWNILENSLSKNIPNTLVEKKVATKEKEKETRLFYEPYISWGKKGFQKEEMYNPGDVAIDKNGFVYVADTFNHQIKKFKLHYSLEKVFGRHGEQPGQFIKPCSIAVGPDNLIYAADMMNNRIQVFDSNGKFVRTWGSYGKEYGQLANPLAIDVDNNGIVYVADMNNRITSFTSDGTVIDVFGKGGADKGEFSYPAALVHDNETGFLYVADKNNNRIQVFYKKEIKKIFKNIKGLPNGLSSPSGIEIYGKNLFIADSGNNRLVVLDKINSSLKGTCGKKGSNPGEFSGMQGIATLDNNLVFIIDRYNNRLQVLKKK